jgi:hypothetical protein
MKRVNTLHRKSVEFLNLISGGIYSNHFRILYTDTSVCVYLHALTEDYDQREYFKVKLPVGISVSITLYTQNPLESTTTTRVDIYFGDQ